MNARCRLIPCLLCILALFPGCAASARGEADTARLPVAQPVDETGEAVGAARLRDLRDAIREHLRPVPGLPAPAADLEVRPRLIQCPGPWHPAALSAPGDDGGCLGTVAVVERQSGHVITAAVARTPPGSDVTQLGVAMADSVVRAWPAHVLVREMNSDITAGGKTVHYLGAGRFAVAGELIDLHAIRHAYDPRADPDVPQATNITLDDIIPARVDRLGRPYAVFTLYQVDPPLTGRPSREPGIDRGTDFRDPANLVKAAYSNYVSPVLTEDAAPVQVASHPIGHFLIKVEVPGYPTLLTGMTTIARADTELVDLTIGRRLGIGGVLLTPEPGRLNSSAEAVRELALRERPLRIVDGLYFHADGNRNTGPEYLAEDGRVVFLRVRLPVRNAADALAYFAELLQRGEQNRFGSLLNSPFKGTGAGCAAFALSWLQAAGVIPFIARPPARDELSPDSDAASADFWREIRGTLHIPWRLIGCDERVGAARAFPAELTIYDLLFHGETAGFIRKASAGLAEHIRRKYGTIVATLFQIGALTPLRDLVINARREDPEDHADYTWSGPGLDLEYWDNARFSAWIHRVWTSGPRNPHVHLAREGRFVGLEIDAMDAPRQREPFFAAADRRSVRSAGMPPAISCQQVFEQGLE